uniref:Major facilitator superfamily (MFS) profile domain-containing protein n=1 Tax=Parascaris univalens TaxID=6257 RepID=A0A915A4K6_PARUN
CHRMRQRIIYGDIFFILWSPVYGKKYVRRMGCCDTDKAQRSKC